MIQQKYPMLQVARQPGDGTAVPSCPVVAMAATGVEQQCFRSGGLPASVVAVHVPIP